MKMTCSKCNKDIIVNVIELAWHDKGLIRVEGYRCPKCGKMYITAVTDNALRDSLYKQHSTYYDLKDTIKKRNYEYRTYTNFKRPIPTMVQNRWESKINKLQEEYDKLVKLNNERNANLVKWYLRKEA